MDKTLFIVAFGALVLMNVGTWATYRWDKYRAGSNARRVPERTLLGMAFCGGLFGALIAMYAHHARHKTSKPVFMHWIYLIGLVYIILFALLGFFLAFKK